MPKGTSRLTSILGIFFIVLLVIIYFLWKNQTANEISGNPNSQASSQPTLLAQATPVLLSSPTPTPFPTPIPTPDPAVYGPCTNIPVLMYHHVQPEDQAQAKGQKSLTVDAKVFDSQMASLVAKKFHATTPDEFLADVRSGHGGKDILLTFDDGYQDFYDFAYPVINKYNLQATLFIPTGLIGNPDYLTWGELSDMKGSGRITFANHTWSHKSLGKASDQTMHYEVETAQSQLLDHGLGPITTFAYPYGSENVKVDSILANIGIKFAFTTIPGSYQCAKLPFDLRRIRVGNSNLSSYGL